jgi:predicted transposase YbfD/YdcC
VICGADNWADIAMFGEKKINWLRQFLELPNGIPSHETFGRVFGRLDEKQFQQCFFEWVKAVEEVTKGQMIALEGKQLRCSLDGYLGKGAIYMLNAWASDKHMALGQRKVDEKSNEITAIPELLDMLEVVGCTITIDAMGCQTAIAHQIVAKQADYVLAVKENQGHLYEDISYLFDLYLKEDNPLEFIDDYHKTAGKDHGRLETRRYYTLAAERYSASVRNLAEREHIRSLVLVIFECQIRVETTTKSRYFISSAPPVASKMLEAVCSHWGVENGLHWILGVVFDEDYSRVRKDNAP